MTGILGLRSWILASWVLRSWVLVFAGLVGCGASGDAPPAAAPTSEAQQLWSPPPPDRDLVARSRADDDAALMASPLRMEARVDRWLGEMAASGGAIRARLVSAERRRDVVLHNCVSAALSNVEAAERDARRHRDRLREAVLEDEQAARDELGAIRNLAANATSAVTQAEQCVGEEQADKPPADRDGDAILDQVDVDPEYSVRLATLERTVDDARETTRRSRTRQALLADTVLAGGGNASTPTDLHAVAMAAPPTTKPTGSTASGTAPGTAPGTATPGPGPGRSAPHDDSMIIRSAEIAIAVFEVEKKLEAVATSATAAGGYTSERTDRQITIRIPREHFADVLAEVEKLGDVLHRNVSAEDVTDQFVDLEMRLKNAYIVRERLEKLLQGATVKDAVEIHKELSKVTEEIERIEGKLKLLRDRIGYSTITVSFQDTRPPSVRSSALLPFPWMNTIGLGPLLSVPR